MKINLGAFNNKDNDVGGDDNQAEPSAASKLLNAKNSKKVGKWQEKNWYRDRFETVRLQRNVCVAFMFSFIIISVVLVIALTNLTPLKTVEPFVIRVDEKSGRTQIVQALTDRQIKSENNLIRYFVWEYIQSRESFHLATYQENYRKVSLMTDRQILEDFMKHYRSTNSENYFNVYGDSGKRTVEVESISFLPDNNQRITGRVALVDVEVTSEDKNRVVSKFQQRITVHFTTEQKAVAPRNLYLNPIGFVVKEYTVTDKYSES